MERDSTGYVTNVERFFKKIIYCVANFQKSVITTVRGIRV
jgi:hypothetical protein